MTPPLPTDFEELKQLAIEQDWLVKKTAGGHWKFIPPRGKATVIASSTPGSDSHIQPLRQQLRKAGLLGITPERNKPEPAPDTTNYFSMPPAEAKTVIKKIPYGSMKEIVLEAIKRQGGRWAYPEDIFAHIQAKMPNINMNKLKIAMNGYAQTKTLVKSEEGKYAIPVPFSETLGTTPPPRAAKPAVFVPPPPASEEDLKVLYGALEALAAAEQVIKKHIAIEGQLGQMKALLGGLSHGTAKEENQQAG